MISNVGFQNSNSLNKKVSFGSASSQNTSVADAFVSGVAQIKKDQQSKYSFGNIFWSPVATIPSSVVFVLSQIKSVRKLKTLQKASSPEFATYKKSLPKRLLFALAIYDGSIFALQKLFSLNFDKKYEDVKKYFNEVNKTHSKLNEETFRSGYMGAFYSPISGKVHINKNMINDPWNNFKTKYLIKHELVHAKQYETIARMQDGIKKLNYLIVKRIAKPYDNPAIKPEFMQICQEVLADKTGKYDNVTLELPEADVNFKDYIAAVNTVLTNPEATYKDIPIIINQEHYQKVVEADGPLKPEEIEKAKVYYQAAADYPAPNFFNMLNPFSKYYKNPLEKEAYKENPWYTRIF